ncbi:transposase [Streptomyces coeruleorubidus]|uniref:transposase n=1 Tax=Streptomyces coeruleorubidus TaxID=116188 RepID=UPI00237FA6A4|nr:transposase [Streptomyces coeruleorubidus]WDV56605.1 transposase [Streptomyces coeruleorubidus]
MESTFIARRPAAPRPSQLDTYKPYLETRWVEGHTNAVHLHAELKELGYRGNYQTISDYLRPGRRRRIRVVGSAPPGFRQATGWIMRHPDRLSESESKQLTDTLARCPELAAADRLVRNFGEILSTRTGQHLKDWVISARAENLPGLHSFRTGQHLKDWVISARAENLPGLHSFASGLGKDWDVVVQGLTTPWNSGPVEGRVNHIKMVKRQMFGRAKLPLLRKRVLLTAVR